MSSNSYFVIFGAKGWIGQQVCDYLQKNNMFFYCAKSRADDEPHIIIEELNNLEIPVTHIMSFIGRTHGEFEGEKISTIDYLEKPGKLVDNVKDNLYSPVSLAILCQEYGIHFTYLGTGCIFDYDESHVCNDDGFGHGFVEEDTPNFFGSSYSIVKGYTDRLMHKFGNVLNVRIRMPITSTNNERNFITKITKYSKICSIPNSMTVLDELIPIMIDMAENRKVGTVNMTNPGVISHNEILEMYKEIVDPTFTWTNFTVEEQDQILLSKRSNNMLDTMCLETDYPNVNPIKDAVRRCLCFMKMGMDNEKVEK